MQNQQSHKKKKICLTLALAGFCCVLLFPLEEKKGRRVREQKLMKEPNRSRERPHRRWTKTSKIMEEKKRKKRTSIVDRFVERDVNADASSIDKRRDRKKLNREREKTHRHGLFLGLLEPTAN